MAGRANGGPAEAHAKRGLCLSVPRSCVWQCWPDNEVIGSPSSNGRTQPHTLRCSGPRHTVHTTAGAMRAGGCRTRRQSPRGSVKYKGKLLTDQPNEWAGGPRRRSSHAPERVECGARHAPSAAHAHDHNDCVWVQFFCARCPRSSLICSTDSSTKMLRPCAPSASNWGIPANTQTRVVPSLTVAPTQPALHIYTRFFVCPQHTRSAQ